jgi:hypothetical protein
VIGDSMAEWLAYGLEQAYAESADIGVVRKVRQSTGLIDQCKGEVRKWVEQSLANEKPVFVAIMIGINDRHSMQACEPSGKSDGAKAASYAFRSKQWAEAYGKEVHEAISLLKSKDVPVFWTNTPPVKPNERAIAGPVVPLTESTHVKGDALLGGPGPSDARLLGGEPPAPARGRADDFSWPRSREPPAAVQEGTGYAQEGSDVTPKPSKPTPRGSSRKSRENAR